MSKTSQFLQLGSNIIPMGVDVLAAMESYLTLRLIENWFRTVVLNHVVVDYRIVVRSRFSASDAPREGWFAGSEMLDRRRLHV